MKRPSFQFYPADWRKDAALQSCSLASRGLWHEMLCLMHECEPYGYLSVNGKPMKPAQIARLVGVSEREYAKLVQELMDAGVPSVSDDGSIYSRRMVRDEHIRNVRAEAGKKGGNPNLIGDKVKQKVKQTDNHELNQSLTPSSSSSSSGNSSVPNGTGAEAPPEGLTAQESVFQVAVPWLVAAGCKESSVRSLLGGAVKQLSADGAWALASECMREKPIEPIAWLAAAINARIKQPRASPNGRAPQAENLDSANYGQSGRL